MNLALSLLQWHTYAHTHLTSAKTAQSGTRSNAPSPDVSTMTKD